MSARNASASNTFVANRQHRTPSKVVLVVVSCRVDSAFFLFVVSNSTLFDCFFPRTFFFFLFSFPLSFFHLLVPCSLPILTRLRTPSSIVLYNMILPIFSTCTSSSSSFLLHSFLRLYVSCVKSINAFTSNLPSTFQLEDHVVVATYGIRK